MGAPAVLAILLFIIGTTKADSGKYLTALQFTWYYILKP